MSHARRPIPIWYLDWNVYQDLSDKQVHTDTRERLLRLRRKGSILLPYTQEHVREAIRSQDVSALPSHVAVHLRIFVELSDRLFWSDPASSMGWTSRDPFEVAKDLCRQMPGHEAYGLQMGVFEDIAPLVAEAKLKDRRAALEERLRIGVAQAVGGTLQVRQLVDALPPTGEIALRASKLRRSEVKGLAMAINDAK